MRKFLIGCALVAGMGAMLPSASFAQDVQIEIGRDGLRLKEACDSRYENCRDDRRGRDYARTLLHRGPCAGQGGADGRSACTYRVGWSPFDRCSRS